jgi:single-stranded-DNA-specific exonuclease
LKELADRGVGLVITVDCGIRAVAEARYGRRLGLDLIITDHHLPPEELPPAVALINPRLPGCRYPFKELPGVGLAYKLAQALLRVERRVPLGIGRDFASLPSEEELLDLVALGIVADLAALVGENRALVQRGLEVLNRTQRVGLLALMEVAGVQPGQVGTETIGYILGPRLNAAGRLDHAMVAYRLLVTEDPAEARTLAEQLDARNRERQEMTQWVLDQVLDQLEGSEDKPFLVAWGEDFAPGVVGLVASRLTEQFYRPSLVLELGPETAHGSARSIPEFDIVRALDRVSDLLIKYGGHAMAAGLTIARDKVELLRERLVGIAAQELADVELVPLLNIDAEWPLEQLTPQTFQRLRQLEPFGIGNPAPLLLSRNVRLRDYAAVGENEAHLRLKLESRMARGSGHVRIIWDAMAFGQGYWAAAMPERVDIVYTPKIEVWNNEERLRLEVVDLKPAASGQQPAVSRQ